jgi:putative acetyltransferase
MQIRPYVIGEEMALLAIFQSSVRGLAVRDYTSEQIDAWSPRDCTKDVRAQWTARIRANRPWVAEVEGEPAGFADLQPTGYIDQFFVAAPFARKGVGTALMAHLENAASEQGIKRLFAHVSLTAQPFFARHGFRMEEERLPVVRGVALRSAVMSISVLFCSMGSVIHLSLFRKSCQARRLRTTRAGCSSDIHDPANHDEIADQRRELDHSLLAEAGGGISIARIADPVP